MPLNHVPYVRQVLSDLLIVVILQVTSLPTDITLKLQLAALSGSMLAVRMLDGKQKILDLLRVAFSGLVVANYAGFYLCEVRNISLTSYTALFYFVLIGIFSDILIRACKSFGNVILKSVPELTNLLIEKTKNYLNVK